MKRFLAALFIALGVAAAVGVGVASADPPMTHNMTHN
jgi:hypothetical protein